MKLSIITINYNNKDGLQKTIDSVISQTFKDFEWIIIDGGSTDGSKELIEKYSQHITYWVSEPDKGIYNAMNKGIVKAKGEYLYFLNSGDCLFNKYVLKNIFSTQHNGDILYGNNKNSKDNFIISETIYPNQLTIKFFIKGPISHQATFIKKKCFETRLYDESMRYCSDSKLFIILMMNNYEFEFLNQFVAIVDTTGVSSKSDNLITMRNEKKQAIEELIPKNILLDYNYFLHNETLLENELVILALKVYKTNRYCRYFIRLLMNLILLFKKNH